jgi:mycothiol synthase
VLDTLTTRPLRRGDVPAWTRLLAAAEEVDQSGEHYSEADLDEELGAPGLDLDADSLAVLDGRQLVGSIVLHQRRGAAGAGDIVNCDGVVHPGRRGQGIGGRLLEFGRGRAAQLGAELHLRVMDTNAGAIGLASSLGMTPVRWWSEMRRDLALPVAAVPPPDGVELRPLGPGYDAGRWDEPLRAARNLTFAQHWGSSPEGPEAWRQMRTGSSAFCAELSLAATAADEIAAYLLAYEYSAVGERTGSRELHVGTVGTLPAWRGRGLAGAMLSDVLARAAAAGFASSSLTADTQNATGAVGVYERVGYTVAHRAITYALPL